MLTFHHRFANPVPGLFESSPPNWRAKQGEGREFRLMRDFCKSYTDDASEQDIAFLGCNTQHELILFCDRQYGFYVAQMEQDPDSWEPFEQWDFGDDFDAAWKFFSEWAEKPVEPNWEAQAEYDEAHGTINGEDARIVAYRELVGEG